MYRCLLSDLLHIYSETRKNHLHNVPRKRVVICILFDTYSAGIFKQSNGAMNRVGIGLSYQPARLQPGGIGSLESILRLLKSLNIRAQDFVWWVRKSGWSHQNMWIMSDVSPRFFNVRCLCRDREKASEINTVLRAQGDRFKGTVSWDRFQKFRPNFKKLGLTKGRGWCLNFLGAPMIL
jgi:hypothetical protein